MKNINHTKKFLGLLIISMSAAILNACSDDTSEKTAAATAPSKARAPEKKHVEHGEASDTVKFKFEKEFAAKCVGRELQKSGNPESDKWKVEETCGCIARHISEDLSDVDAEKYLQEHEDTHTLQIKFDAAAYFCLQDKVAPKGPHLFGKQK
ncbi:MAG: hypothetical protein ACXV7J_00995 [Methylomonas sp.]